MSKNDLTQIVKVVQNDNSKFELLHQQISNRVYFWSYSIVKNETDANDLAQESMIAIYRGINTLKNPEYFTTWMYKIVRSKGLNYLKKSKTKNLGFIEDDEYYESFTTILEDQNIDGLPKESFDLNQTKETVLTLIDKLPKRQKEVVYLHYIEELKVSEIAEVLEYNIGSVKSSLFKARANLKTSIESYQKQNNVQLYSMALIPLLILTLSDYVDEICKTNKNTYNSKDFIKNTKLNSLRTKLSSISLTTISATVVLIASIVVAMIYLNLNENQSEETKNDAIQEDLMRDKTKKYELIQSIGYIRFPVREMSVEVVLTDGLQDAPIQIKKDDKELQYEQKDNIIYFYINENGNYQVSVKEERITFEVSNIVSDAPELLEVKKRSDHIELQIDGNTDVIDKSKSYVLYQGKQLPISTDYKVSGVFEHDLQVVLFDKENNEITYDIHNLNK